jgi:hypothetical protein
MTERMERAVKPSSGVENETHAIPDKVDNTLINIDFFTVSPALFSANENHCKAWRDSAKTATNMNVQAVTSLDEFLHFPGATWNCTRFVLDPLVRSAPGGRGRKEAERSARRLAAGPRGKAEGTLFTSRSRSASRRLPAGCDGHRGARGVLPLGHLGQPLGHIGPFRIQRARPLKGGRGVGKPSLG